MSSVGAIDVYGLVDQLMQVERQPVTLLENRKGQYQKKADALDSLNKLLGDISTKAAAFDTATEWDLLKASSSSTAVTASVTSGGVSGSITFTVDALATAEKLYSTSTLSSTSDTVSTASHLLLAAGGSAYGFSQLSADNDLSIGSHTLTVTQASEAATTTGTVLGTSVTIDNTNDQLLVEVNGQEYTFTIAHGTGLGRQDLVDRLNTAIDATGAAGALTASLTSTGELKLATTREGSAATVQVTSGSGLADYGLAVQASATAGTDGIVELDGVETTLTSIEAGDTANLASTAGTVDVTLSGGLRAGTLKASNVDLGDGSLSAVVSAINNSGSPVSASAIKVGDSAYRFQIQAKTSGVAGRLNVDLSTLDGISSFSTLTAGTDASITVGGTSPFSVTSSSNTFADVLPGVSFTLGSQPTDSVTVTATRDQDSLAARVQALVDSTNKAIRDIATKTAYSSDTKTGGALQGDYTVRRLRQNLTEAITTTVATGDLQQAGEAGITVSKDGTLAFDKTKFLTAYNDDPNAVQRLFFAADSGDANPGITQRITSAVKAANDSVDGYLTTSAKTKRSAVTDLGKQIDRWEDRLAIRRQTLITQFANLNTALQSLGQQSQWITGQLAGLA